jgi:DNA (cytosine-5)-methyltransferase 1
MRAIDLFAGAGGFSTGARMAGCNVVWAANHWPVAVSTHAANHPDTQHACQDLQQANWLNVPAHDLLLASPACQGHSPARGKERPHHDVARSTAWAVVSALECHRPKAAIVENVPQFTKWVLFSAWCQAVTALGYAIAPHLIDAADHGVAQNRLRVFLVLTRSKHPLQLEFNPGVLAAASSVVDFDAGRWATIDRPGRAAKTLARVAQGRRQHGDRFVMAFYGAEKGGRSLSRPLGTVTTHDRWALIDGDRMRMISVPEARRAMGFPDDYQLPENSRLAMHLLGNAVVPVVARDVIDGLRKAA